MAAQAVLAAAVVGTVVLNAADVFIGRLHKKQAKKALMGKEKAREEEETSSEEEESVPVIARRRSSDRGSRRRQSSIASRRPDMPVQDPRYSRNRSSLPGSAYHLSPNSNPNSDSRLASPPSPKPDSSLGVYHPRSKSFPSSNTAEDPAFARQIALASSIISEHRRDRQTKRGFSSVGARANVMPPITAPATQNLLTEHEHYRVELDPLLSQLREQRQQRDREILYKPTPKPQSQWPLEQCNTLSEGNISPAPPSINYTQDETTRSPSISRNRDELTRSQSYANPASTPSLEPRRASQPSQWRAPGIEERRRAAEYLTSRSIRSPVARSIATPSTTHSGPASTQQASRPTNQLSISSSAPSYTDNSSAVPPLSWAGQSSSDSSTGSGPLPRNYSATVSDEASEVYIGGPVAEVEMAEPRGLVMDRWLGDADTPVAEVRGYPPSHTSLFEERKSNPLKSMSRK